ncbi:peroxidase family protein [Arthrobacter pigmenti]
MENSSRRQRRRRYTGRKLTALASASAMAVTGLLIPGGVATAAPPPGQDFNVTVGDLQHILKQIDISEAHAEDVVTENQNSSPLCKRGKTFSIDEQQFYDADGDPCVGDPMSPSGLRTVSGRWNNLMAGQDGWGQGLQKFPRMLDPVFRDADPVPPGNPFGPPAGTPTTYKSTDGSYVYDSEPRTISNLIVDQTTANPAATQVAQRVEGAGVVDGAIFNRIAGATLFDTSAAISQNNFQAGVPVVYIARGDYFSDALAGGPAAKAAGGPLLLVKTDELPAKTQDELTRLAPQKIVVLGGPKAVSDATLNQLGDFTTGAVERLAGATKFHTAVEISKATQQPGVDRVYVATGDNFPDALAAAAPAARDGHPILLVKRGSIPGATLQELQRLQPAEIVVLGGHLAINEATYNALAPLAPSIQRIGGATLYDTAALISKAFFTPPVEQVYLSTGENFPDALSIAGIAGAKGAPILLVPSDGTIPPSVMAELERLQPKNATILGGPSAINAAVETQLTDQAEGKNIFIPDIATDEGLSASATSWFTFFGQFFDHGLDQVSKGGNGTIVVPLQPDDPLYNPESHTNFLTLTRATIEEGEGQNHENRTTPFVDQNQTYTSHPSHQVFLREYEMVGGVPIPTGHLLDSPVGGMPTWNDVKRETAEMLGIQLVDMDVLEVPMLRTDPYGRFVPGDNGLPQIVLEDGTLLEGNLANPVEVPDNAVRAGHAFLDDIAHGATPVEQPNPEDPTLPGYEIEKLGSHFITGDGRGNENMALTSVHHVFHSEHNRVMEQIEGVLNEPGNEELLAAYQEDSFWGYGERLFQAARFFTEMQYQHLVFEEFARRIQPNIDPTQLNENSYMPDVNPAITAEFAHVVYRFGHSLLRENVPREINGEMVEMPLFDAFLNPEGYLKAPDGSTLTPDQAAGSLVRGLTHQTANGIDEFVTNTLRNQLLGLPLDLATINMARARDAGVPGLQAARQSFYEATQHPELKPYDSWEDFRLSMKNPESIVNFVAAYGIHPTLESATTLDAKRTAATALVADTAFMSSPAAESGLNDVDFWMGGLAEKPFIFGGMLGTTFDFVFEQQLENLQNGDRFYYLSRNLPISLFHTLEGNSFSQLIMRNTTADKLPHDVFAAPQTTFDLTTPAADLIIAGLTNPNGQWRYTGEEHVVMQGTDAADNMRSGLGDDSIWGKAGNDRIEGDDGNDALMGGDGDDIVTDINGDDRLQGEAGNDAIDGGPGFDLLFGGSGKDFINGGNDNSTLFAGLGDDFVLGSSGADNARGDEGSDWIEGQGGGTELLVGDLSNTMQNDPALWHGGHDVTMGGAGNTDHDAEGGDDIMFAGAASDRFGGQLGFDWVTHKNYEYAVNADMGAQLILPGPINALSDRYLNVEATSGWNGNDVIRGATGVDDITDPAIGTLGYGHRLTQEHLDRVTGLRDLLGGGDRPEYSRAFLEGEPADDESFNSNILLGGQGSDLIEPREGSNFVDGDAWLDARVEYRPEGGPVESADSITKFQNRVFSGEINPADLHIVREIQNADSNEEGTVDTAVFAGIKADYTIGQPNPGQDPNVWQVSNVAEVNLVDTVRNVERLQFSDTTVCINDDGTLTEDCASANGTVTLDNMAPTEDEQLTATADINDPQGNGEFVYELQILTDASQDGYTNWWVTTQTNETGTFTLSDAEVGVPVRVLVSYVDGSGAHEQVASDATEPVININDVPVPQEIGPADPIVGDVMFVSEQLSDDDGAEVVLEDFAASYQWQQGTEGGAWTDIQGATGDTFVVTDAQQGLQIRLVTTYDDDQGTSETAISAPSSVVNPGGTPAP